MARKNNFAIFVKLDISVEITTLEVQKGGISLSKERKKIPLPEALRLLIQFPPFVYANAWVVDLFR